MIDKSIFRAYDIRGVYGETITPKIMESIGRELRKMFPNESFVVGNDIRSSSEELAGALIKGLMFQDGEVIYAGTTAFGESLFGGFKLKKDKNLYITASHSPPEWNGVKLYYGDGEAFTSELNYKIGDMVAEHIGEIEDYENYTEFLDKANRVNLKDEYIKFMKDNFKITKPLKAVIDCGNGSTCLTAPKVFESLVFIIVILNGNVDPTFPGRTSDIKETLLDELYEKVKSEGADFGVAFDGDGDRVILVDENGRPYNGSITGIMIAKNILNESGKKKIVITQPVSMAAETELKPLGGEVIRIPVGHTYAINSAKKENALMGIEESGHLIITDYFYFDDGLIAPLKAAEIMCNTGKKLSELMGEIPIYPFDEIVFECKEEVKFRFIEEMYNRLSKEYDDTSSMDGLRIGFEDGWILLRASNTGPKIRLYIEATSRERFNELKDKFSGLFFEELNKW
jgi:phosphomannomutase